MHAFRHTAEYLTASSSSSAAWDSLRFSSFGWLRCDLEAADLQVAVDEEEDLRRWSWCSSLLLPARWFDESSWCEGDCTSGRLCTLPLLVGGCGNRPSPTGIGDLPTTETPRRRLATSGPPDGVWVGLGLRMLLLLLLLWPLPLLLLLDSVTLGDAERPWRWPAEGMPRSGPKRSGISPLRATMRSSNWLSSWLTEARRDELSERDKGRLWPRTRSLWCRWRWFALPLRNVLALIEAAVAGW